MKPQLPTRFLACFISFILIACIATAVFAQVALAETPATLNTFVAAVVNGEANVARGAYVSNGLALPIEQQPTGEAGFVTDTPNAVSQFQSAAQSGVTGLLAHNTLAGAQFAELQLGQEVSIVYGDGTIRRYAITSIQQFQAAEPSDPTSNFVDTLTGTRYSAAEVFNQMYSGDEHVTFQTCIEREGEVSWGRLFVIATPLQ